MNSKRKSYVPKSKTLKKTLNIYSLCLKINNIFGF